MFKLPLNKLKKSPGFTLIELLIVVVTMSLMFGIGFANYRDFQGRQILQGAVEKIKGDLRFTQELALAGKKPTGCDVLNSYTIKQSGTTTYQTLANCANGDYIERTYNLDKFPDVQIDSWTIDTTFRILGRGVVSNSTIVLERGSEVQTIEVKKGGDIKNVD